jgi:hypothetical protein
MPLGDTRRFPCSGLGSTYRRTGLNRAVTERFRSIVSTQLEADPVQEPSQRAKLVPGLEIDLVSVTTVPASKL